MFLVPELFVVLVAVAVPLDGEAFAVTEPVEDAVPVI